MKKENASDFDEVQDMINEYNKPIINMYMENTRALNRMMNELRSKVKKYNENADYYDQQLRTITEFRISFGEVIKQEMDPGITGGEVDKKIALAYEIMINEYRQALKELCDYENYVQQLIKKLANKEKLPSILNDDAGQYLKAAPLKWFTELEQRLYDMQYIDKSRKWKPKAKEILGELVYVLLEDNWFRKEKETDRAHRAAIRKWFERRYQSGDISQQLKPYKVKVKGTFTTTIQTIKN